MSAKIIAQRPLAEGTNTAPATTQMVRRPSQPAEDHRTAAHPAPARKLRLPAYVRHA